MAKKGCKYTPHIKFHFGKKYKLKKRGGGQKYEFQIYYTPLSRIGRIDK